jgi:Cu/Ag efflux protein CusF
MKRIALAVAVLSSAVSLAYAQVKDSAMAVQEAEAVVTVTKIDKEARSVTFRGPRGNLGTLDVPKESQNFDQVKVGQQYKMKYVEAVAVSISKGGAPSAAAAQDVKLNPKGKPGGVMVRTVQLAGVIDAVDYNERYIAVRGPKGNVTPLKVAGDVDLQQLAAGDRISVTHTAALAIEMVAQAPAKKAPAKKEAAKK